MARQTLYIVQPFRSGNRGVLEPGQPTKCKTEEEAIRRATAMKDSKVGVVAYSASGDPATGDYDEKPTVLFKAGRVPPEFEE